MADNILIGIITGVVLLLVGGVGWLAYNHPERFEPILTIIQAFNLAAVVGVASYNQGLVAASRQIEGSMGKIWPLHIDGWWLLPIAAWHLYLVFLNVAVTKWKAGNNSSKRRRR